MWIFQITTLKTTKSKYLNNRLTTNQLNRIRLNNRDLNLIRINTENATRL